MKRETEIFIEFISRIEWSSEAYAEIPLEMKALFSWYIDHPFPFLVNKWDEDELCSHDQSSSRVKKRFNAHWHLSSHFSQVPSDRIAARGFLCFQLIVRVNRCPSTHPTDGTVKWKQRLQHEQETSIDHFQREVSPLLAPSQGSDTMETNIPRITPLCSWWNGKKEKKRNPFLLLEFSKKTEVWK